MPQVISANRLIDGLVVYAGRDGSWAERLGEAKVFASKDEAEAALLNAQNDVKRNLVVDLSSVEVTGEGSGLRAVSLRESIRARGPTIDFLPPARAFAYEADPVPGKETPQAAKARSWIARPDVSRKHELIDAADAPEEIAR